jgi:hypothetical protein
MKMVSRLLMALAGLIAVVTQAAAQSRLLNDVPIRITWRAKGPDRVAFEGRNGRTDFTRAADHFEGRRPVPGSVAYHNLALSYGSEDFPITLRTVYDMDHIGLQIDAPTDMACTSQAVRGLAAVPEASAQTTRLRTMVQARHLLRRQTDVCVDFGRRALAGVYFRMSCSLARSTDFFMVSEEAKTYFRQTAVDAETAEQAIRDCDAATQIADARRLADARLVARQAGNFERAAAISGEWTILSQDEAWRSALATQQIDPDHIRRAQVADLVDWQDASRVTGDYRQALDLNRQLSEFSRNPLYVPALNAASITPARLQLDRDYFEGRLDRPTSGVGGRLSLAEARRRDWRAYNRYDWNRAPRGGAYYADDYYRDGRYYRERRLSANDRIYRGRDGRYYCRRTDGTTGLIIGADVGAQIGGSIDEGRSSTLGTVLGATAGAAVGREIDRSSRNDLRCR